VVDGGADIGREMLGAMNGPLEPRPSQDRDPPEPVDPLGELDSLIDEGRYVDAVEWVLQRLPVVGADAAVLNRLVHVERMLGRDDVALSVCEMATRCDVFDLAATVTLASALASMHRYRKGLALLHDLPSEVRNDRQVRTARASVYEGMGLHVLAYDASGQSWRPWTWQGRVRLRLWWRTGGPLVFVRRRRRRRDEAAFRDWPADPPPGNLSADLDALMAQVRGALDEYRRTQPLLDRADRLIDDGEYGAAAGILGGGLSADPSTIALLVRLAWVENLAGRDQAALTHLAEARRLDPANLEGVRDHVRLLTSRRRFREALAVLDELPEVDRRVPDIRTVRAELYQAMGLPTLAHGAYGDRHTLGRWQRRQRRRDWWRSGGPLRWLLWRPRRFEVGVLRLWRVDSQNLRALDAIDWPAGFDPTDIRNRVDFVLQRAALVGSRWWSIAWWTRRTAQLVAIAAAGLILLDIARRAGALALPLAVTWAVAATGLSFALYRLIFGRLIDLGIGYQVILRGVPAGLALIGIGYLLTQATWPSRTLAGGMGAIILTVAGTAAVVSLAIFPVSLSWTLSLWRLWHNNPREDMVDDLLRVLDGLDDRTAHNDLGWRARWIYHLERAARNLEKRLPPLLRIGDPVTTNWAAAGAKGAATALRRLRGPNTMG
jgi:tetratricopeptide (TPR) repeat protein